jgi:hypothetical protein
MLGSVLLAAALSAAAPAPPEGPRPDDILPPAPAWTGKSERLVVRPDHPWITPAERTGLTATPSYDETIAWLKRLADASPLIRMEPFGKTAQGRELWVVIASKDGDRLDSEKPLVLGQAGIHAGEIDGKDAGLMLLRDLAFRGKDGLLDRVNLAFVPVFNADGHERASPYARPNQRGPEVQGWRTNAQNLNLNRDYAKADSPEMRAMLALIRRLDPDLYLDLHVTDGLDYQHDVTFVYEGWGGAPSRSAAGSAWLETALRPTVERALADAGHVPGPYVDPVDSSAPEKGLTVASSPARFSTGYGDAVGLPTVLLETHSLKPYRRRVLGAYVFVEAALKAAAAEGAALKAAKAADRAQRPTETVLAWKPNPKPFTTFRFRPVERTTYRSQAAGGEVLRWTGRPLPAIDVPVFGAEPAVVGRLPKAWWIPATKPEVIERLRAHGIAFETLAEPRTVEVELARLEGAEPAVAVFEGRVGTTVERVVRERRTETYPAGSVRAPTDQPLGVLATLMLDPESEESLLRWGFFPEILQRTEYMEAYVLAPLADRMLAADAALKAEFEAKLAADPAFVGDRRARLNWFYERSPYLDARWRLYPVGAER